MPRGQKRAVLTAKAESPKEEEPKVEIKAEETVEEVKKPNRPPRARRSDEEMEQLLLERLQKIQERLAKKNANVYTEIGYLLCKMTNCDAAKLTDEQKEALANKTDEGKAIVKQLVARIIMMEETARQLDLNEGDNVVLYDYPL